jgi:hypothetical protein
VGVLVAVVTLVLVVGALVDIITTEVPRHLPKLVWVFLVILLPLVGSIVWFAVGHDWSAHRAEAVPFGDPRRHEEAARRMRAPEYEVDPGVVEAELRFAEKEAKLRRLEAELEARRRQRGEAPEA